MSKLRDDVERLCQEEERLIAEIAGLEKDLQGPDSGWQLGDPYETLANLRRQLAEVQAGLS